MSLLEPFWQRAWNDAQPALQHAASTLSSTPAVAPRAVRVGQLDAELLDQELVALLKQPLTASLSLAKAEWAARWDLEISFLIQALLYKYSIWRSGATYGAKLQDLHFEKPARIPGRRYTPSGFPQRVLALHAFLTLVVPYLHARARAYALSHSWPDIPRSDVRRKLWEALTSYEALHNAFGLAGFLSFLWNGRYRSIIDWLLGLKLVPAKRVVARNVNYEFMNRQMVWHAFTEFLLFILPLINMRSLRKRAIKSTAFISDRISGVTQRVLGTYDYSNVGGNSKTPKRGKYATLSDDCCAICAEDARTKEAAGGPAAFAHMSDTSIPSFPLIIPYRTSCGHDYCYSCLTDQMLRAADDGDAGWECLRCQAIVTGSYRLEEKAVADDVQSDTLSDDDENVLKASSTHNVPNSYGGE